MIGGRRTGFTLLEILVALVVLGFLMVGLTQGVRLGIAVWTRQAQMIERRDDLDAVDRTFRNLVQKMDPGTRVDPPLVEGTPGTFSFTSVLPSALGSESADMAIGLDRDHRLVLHWSPHLHAKRFTPPPAPRTAVLLERVERIEFEYWRPEGGWVRTWTAHRLPALVRLHIVFPGGDLRHWPDLVAAPMRANPVD